MEAKQPDGRYSHFELVSCRCVDTYVRIKRNQNQICWKWRKVREGVLTGLFGGDLGRCLLGHFSGRLRGYFGLPLRKSRVRTDTCAQKWWKVAALGVVAIGLACTVLSCCMNMARCGQQSLQDFREPAQSHT